MSSTLSPAADYVLELGLTRALGFIQARDMESAVRCLTLATDTANLIDVAERARIVGSEGEG